MRRISSETKASFKTTELIAYVGAVVAVIIVSLAVKTTDNHAALYASLLGQPG